MKRKLILLAALCILFLTGAARAADTVDRDCLFVTALYSADGQFLESSCEEIPAGSIAPEPTRFEETGRTVKTFLLDAVTFAPYAPKTTPMPTPDSDVYAILYDDGTMVIQQGNVAEEGKIVSKMREINLEHDSFGGDFGDAITVRFADKIQPKSTAYWFYACWNLTAIENIENLDTSQVTDMSTMFMFCDHLEELDLSSFDTSNVTGMTAMFWGCNSLKHLNLSSFDTSNVEDMGAMFSHCESLTELDVSNFNTSHVTSMGNVSMGTGMFAGCSSLTELDLSNFDTSQVTSMMYMFWDCTNLKNLNISSFDTSKVKNMRYMFAGCSALTELDLSNFDTSNVENYDDEEYFPGMVSMFRDCSGLAELDLSSFDTSNVGAMYDMFSGCTSLTKIDLLSFDTSGVWSMSGMFSGCVGLTELDLSSFDTSNVSISGEMFSGCSNLTAIYASDKFVIDETQAYYDASDNQSLFADCVSLVGGNGTKYDENHTDSEYARIDNPPDAPGYFTRKDA